TTIERLDSARNLLAGKNRGHVDVDAFAREGAHRVKQGLAARVGHWQFHEYVLAPGRDDARLRNHFGNVIGKNLEGDMPVGYGRDEVARVGFIIADPGLPEQRRVGGESRDPRLLGHFHDLRLVRAVGEQLDLQLLQSWVRHRGRFYPVDATI